MDSPRPPRLDETWAEIGKSKFYNPKA